MGQIRSDTSRNYGQDPVKFLHLEDFQNQHKHSEDFWYGAHAYPKESNKGCRFLDLESPIASMQNIAFYERYCKQAYLLCPFSVDWINNITDRKVAQRTFFPFDPRYIPEPQEKIYDVCFVGNASPFGFFPKMLETMCKFKYAYVSMQDDPRVTHRNCSYQEKLKVIAQSKITLVHNTAPFPPQHLDAIKALPHWRENYAYQRLDLGEYPQLKSRAFEASFCKSLILCRKDHWSNMTIGEYFDQDLDFRYYEDGDLEQQILGILRNYWIFEDMIDSAYEIAINNYTTKHWFERILNI